MTHPDPRRRLPAVDALLTEPDIVALVAAHPRSLVVRAVRDTLDAARANDGAAPAEGWGAAVLARAHRLAAPSFGPVINATGVVLHTNLGRAPLAPGAKYLVRVRGATNLNGATADPQGVLAVPTQKPAARDAGSARRDTTKSP